MKNRGKNKKKQWNKILKTLESDVENSKRAIKISNINHDCKISKEPYVKGDKEAAKSFQYLPSHLESKKYYKFDPRTYIRNNKLRTNTFVDVWGQDSSSKSCVKKESGPILDLPLKGQSYRPTSEDHSALLKFLEADESIKLKKEERANKLFSKVNYEDKPLAPTELAEKYFTNRAEGKPLACDIPETDLPDDHAVPIKLKNKHVSAKKRFRREIAEIPITLKEIKQKEIDIHKNREARKAREILRHSLKENTNHIAFQFPQEVNSSLRQLVTVGSPWNEIELRKNKHMLKRTGIPKVHGKSIKRRSRKL